MNDQSQDAGSIPLSILDFAITSKGFTAKEALDHSIQLAKLADRRGFHRYWVAEHHSMPGVSTSSPSLLIARLISETHYIRLGSGGVMLPNTPPLVIAEQFGLLSSLAPGRIDLGIGRASGTNSKTTSTLQQDRLKEGGFPRQFTELRQFLGNKFSKKHSYYGKVFAVPGPAQNTENEVLDFFNQPEVWLLGSSFYSARIAGRSGLPFAFAAQLSPQNLEIALETYRKEFRPSSILDKPYTLACFAVNAADNNETAFIESKCYAHAMMRMMLGNPFVIPSPEELLCYNYSNSELKIVNNWHNKILHGTALQIKKQLNHFQSQIKFNELMILNVGHSLQGIFQSVNLLADAYKMPNKR